MIVPMHRVFVVTRADDRDRLLAALRELGTMQLLPVDPPRARADEQAVTALQQLDRALQVLYDVEPAGEAPDISPRQAAEEALRIHRQSAERVYRLNTLHRRIEALAMWRDIRLDQLNALREAGVEVRFFSVPERRAAAIRAECVQMSGPIGGRRRLVAIVHRNGEPSLPEEAEPVAWPEQDRPSLREEAAAVDRELSEDADLLARIAHLMPQMKRERDRLEDRVQWSIALRGAHVEGDLFAVQGWVPADAARRLADRLAERGLHAAVEGREPAEDESPPTLIRYARWIRPMQGLFNMLGTVPGYREFDLSGAFMIALPIFAAMLISDGGYGLVLLLIPLLFYRWLAPRLGSGMTQLLIVVGATAVLWGVLTTSFFGLDLSDPKVQEAGHLGAGIAHVIDRLHWITVSMADEDRDLLIRISFLLGAIHLTIARMWRAAAEFPRAACLGSVGWAAFLWGMYGVVKAFVLHDPLNGQTPYPYLLVGGAALAVFFGAPAGGMLRSIGLGLANFPLAAVSSFSDVISYVRLMAVGLASMVLATSFNDLAASTGRVWAAVPILILGHGLNVGLGMIALFAHGVRLNMLEFSSNLGMRWNGRPFEPFAGRPVQEN